MHKRNIRKTKTDKEDCLNLANLFFTNTFKEYIKPEQLYLDLNALSRQYFALDELCVNLKNRYRNLVYLCFPEYELIFKNNTIYSSIALDFIEKYPHANIISNTSIILWALYARCYQHIRGLNGQRQNIRIAQY